jgi:glycosyltransferase involved in cell wall biosynthesis
VKLAIVTTRFIERDMRGGEEAIRVLVNNLKEEHSVYLFASDMIVESYSLQFGSRNYIHGNMENRKNLEINYLRSYIIPQQLISIVNKILIKRVTGNSVFSEIMNSLGWGPLVPSLFKKIYNGDYDVVHSSIFPTATALISYKASLDSNKPFVFTPYYHYRMAPFNNNPLLKRMAKGSTALIACTNKERLELIKIGADPDTTFVIPLAFDTSIIPKDMLPAAKLKEKIGLLDFFVVLTHPWPDKGGINVLRSVALLHNKGYKIALVTIGKPNNEYLLEEHNIRIKNPLIKIYDMGWVEGLRKWEIFSFSDVFALPSKSDAFGLSYLNAWALSKPIIGAKNTSASDIIDDGMNGILVDPDDIESISSGLESLLISGGKDLGRNGRTKLLTKYNPKTMADKYSAVFEVAKSIKK